jgi:hypothetical protein
VGNPVYEIRTDARYSNGPHRPFRNGVVIVRIHNGARQSVTDAGENLSTAIATRDGQRRPLLVDIRKAVPLAADRAISPDRSSFRFRRFDTAGRDATLKGA